MAFIRRVRTASGATAVQIAEYSRGRQRIVEHVGSAHTEAELGLLLERDRELLENPAQGILELGVEPTPPVKGLVVPAGTGLFEAAGAVTPAARDSPGRDLVIARVVEPTSMLDAGRALRDLGQSPASYATMKRTLGRAAAGKYRDRIATWCFQHASTSGDVSLVLYDVTTLLCRHRHNKVYVTNIPASVMAASEVIGSYHDLWHVEQSFRMSKTDLRARPMFHRTRDAIEAHLTIVFAALAVSRSVQNRTGLAVANVIKQLRPLRSATIAINGTTQRFAPDINTEQQAILTAIQDPKVTHKEMSQVRSDGAV